MTGIILLLSGCVVSTVSIFVLGLWIRKIPSLKNTEIATKILHIIILITISAPVLNIVLNITFRDYNYDKRLGIPSLPPLTILDVMGSSMMLLGVVMHILSSSSILRRGKGLPLIALTKELGDNLLYEYLRHPMILGFFFMVIGFGLFSSSSFFLLWSLLVFIPVVVFWLKYFEEYELEMRFGKSYVEYRQRVPFLFPNFRKKPGLQKI